MNDWTASELRTYLTEHKNTGDEVPCSYVYRQHAKVQGTLAEVLLLIDEYETEFKLLDKYVPLIINDATREITLDELSTLVLECLIDDEYIISFDSLYDLNVGNFTD